jgi:hypothetical protein
MKKSVLFISVITILVLLLMKGLYVEWNEIVVVILGSSVIALIFGQWMRNQSVKEFHIISAVIAFFLYWLFSFIDLIGDHYLYYLPTGNEDGRALTLGEKIGEYNDDLLVLCLVAPFIVLLLSLLMTTISKRVSNV